MTRKAIIQLLVFALVYTLSVMPHAWGEMGCYRQKVSFMQKCNWSIKRGMAYMPPHAGCCRVVQRIDMVCVCRTMTEDDEKTIDVKHVYFVSQNCDSPVPAGNKCGSWTIPAPHPPPHTHA
ncbi:unnamed protein product [Urochloa decumbens]|uniref:Bifunctional inhibitor/plant lipid transfer protein/seed storage helical domain-containing protein n=1 Tax=Urochloa decumbens TaxID=240449 RepID=A0ABC9F1C9_9POAL